MSWARRLGEQLALPEGLSGRLIGAVMDLANRRPTRLAIDLLAPTANEHVLDIGCGTGAAARLMLRRKPCLVTCVDRSHAMLRTARKRLSGFAQASVVKFNLAALGSLPFPDKSFDAAIALNMLYFCDVDGVMLRDLRRVLRPGGRLVAYVTHRDSMRNWPFVKHGTHRLFDAEALTAALEAGGFARERIAVHECRITHRVRGLLAHAEV